MQECLFCKIVSGTIPADIVLDNKNILAFKDINPQAPIHILIIPKIHIPTLNEIDTLHTEIIGDLVKTASVLAKQEEIDNSGYRTVFNCNQDGGQTVFHIHLHLIGGRPLDWPPG
jgi:histidine triad (HIT) family protein|tara:strand:+ start:100 stop:444 length:345 start_codon:yes stop_codon:yes gene_type:complete